MGKQVVIEVVSKTDSVRKGVKDVNDLTDAIDQGMNDALKEAGVSVKEFEDALKRTTTQGAKGFQSLRTELRQAKEEAQKLAAQFGENSTQALNAQRRVANLTESVSDFNARVKALNPEAKFQAFNQAAGVGIGLMQTLTGTLQIFGVENEKVKKIAEKFQAALNVTQGLNSLMGYKDALSNIRALFMATTVAEAGATAGATAFGGALAATGVGALAIALGALLYQLNEYIEASKEANKVSPINPQILEDIKELDLQFDLLTGKIDKYQKATREAIGENANALTPLLLDLKAAQERYDKLKKSLDSFGTGSDAEKAELAARLKAVTDIQEKIRITQERYNKEYRNINQQRINDIKDDTKKVIAEVERLANASLIDVKVNTTGVLTELDKIFAELDKEKESKRLAQIKAELQGIKREVTTTATELNQKMFAEEQALADSRLQTAVAAQQGIFNIDNEFANRKQAALEEQRRKGLITEEQYQKKLSAIRLKQLLAEKAATIFNIIISLQSEIAKIAETYAAVPGLKETLITQANIRAGIGIATAAAAVLPKFNTGKLPQFPGVYSGKDNQLAWVASEEAILSAPTTRKYYPAIEAIHKGTVKASEINAFVKNRGKSKQSINAKIDEHLLARLLKKNNKFIMANSPELAQHIADAMQRSENLRRQ